MKKCPFCSGVIQDEAIKCKFCKTFLNDNSKDFLNKILNETIEKTKNNIHLKKVDLSKAVFKIMEVGETLHINEIIKRIINGLNNNNFYINLEKTDVDRIAVIESYLVSENQLSQSKVAECFEKLGNGKFKMIKNPYFIQEKIEVKEDKNEEKKIKKTKNPGKNFIEKLFFNWFFRPKFVNLENINKSKLGRFTILFYILSVVMGLLLLLIQLFQTDYHILKNEEIKIDSNQINIPLFESNLKFKESFLFGGYITITKGIFEYDLKNDRDIGQKIIRKLSDNRITLINNGNKYDFIDIGYNSYEDYIREENKSEIYTLRDTDEFNDFLLEYDKSKINLNISLNKYYTIIDYKLIIRISFIILGLYLIMTIGISLMYKILTGIFRYING